MAITVNLRYEYYLPFGEEKAGDDTSETILLIDSWENQEAIDLHHASPMLFDFSRNRLREWFRLCHRRLFLHQKASNIHNEDLL